MLTCRLGLKLIALVCRDHVVRLIKPTGLTHEYVLGAYRVLLLVLEQDNEAAQALFGEHGLLDHGLGDVQGQSVDQAALHHHLHRQLAHDHVGGRLVVRHGRLQTLGGERATWRSGD